MKSMNAVVAAFVATIAITPFASAQSASTFVRSSTMGGAANVVVPTGFGMVQSFNNGVFQSFSDASVVPGATSSFTQFTDPSLRPGATTTRSMFTDPSLVVGAHESFVDPSTHGGF